MSPPATITMTASQQDLVVAILRAHLPVGTLVSVFGSRARSRARPYSDLDLAIDAGRPLSLDEAAALREAFSESDLPWKVDVADWWRMTDAFQAIVAATRLPLMIVEPD